MNHRPIQARSNVIRCATACVIAVVGLAQIAVAGPQLNFDSSAPCVEPLLAAGETAFSEDAEPSSLWSRDLAAEPIAIDAFGLPHSMATLGVDVEQPMIPLPPSIWVGVVGLLAIGRYLSRGQPAA